MLGHIAVPAIDPSGAPATLSADLSRRLIRRELGFDGIVVTDAMEMAGIGETWTGEGAVRAVAAGADMVLLPPGCEGRRSEPRARGRGRRADGGSNRRVRAPPPRDQRAPGSRPRAASGSRRARRSRRTCGRLAARTERRRELDHTRTQSGRRHTDRCGGATSAAASRDVERRPEPVHPGHPRGGARAASHRGRDAPARARGRPRYGRARRRRGPWLHSRARVGVRAGQRLEGHRRHVAEPGDAREAAGRGTGSRVGGLVRQPVPAAAVSRSGRLPLRLRGSPLESKGRDRRAVRRVRDSRTPARDPPGFSRGGTRCSDGEALHDPATQTSGGSRLRSGSPGRGRGRGRRPREAARVPRCRRRGRTRGGSRASLRPRSAVV